MFFSELYNNEYYAPVKLSDFEGEPLLQIVKDTKMLFAGKQTNVLTISRKSTQSELEIFIKEYGKMNEISN